MLAAVYGTGEGSTDLRVQEVETPEPGPGEVRVRIAISGVNPTDWKARKRSPPAPGRLVVPNQDGAGTIDAVGSGVDAGRVGERVWVLLAAHDSWGTAAEYTVVPAGNAIPLPDDASFELGASLGVPALTAAYCLSADGPPVGRTVLISGGAGAVGHAAIELARFEGAGHVVATVSSAAKAELARQAGAQTVVNYRDADVVEQIRAAVPDGIDRFVEVALDQNLPLDLAVAAPHAMITSYAADPDSVAEVPVRQLMAPNLTLRFMLLYTVPQRQLRDAIERTTVAVTAGALTTLPLHRFALEQIAEAHDAVEGGAVGKVIIELR
ncbi:MAG TPA: NADPH:quinone reductase [Solirubrobacteraceae bacterium]|nr:NADPH:quinone reductase [Solirubrobacteraceae bacterium]